MAAPPQHVMWIDPGGMTGIALWDRNSFRADEHLPFPACQLIETYCQRLGSALYVGWEKFTIGPNTHKLTRQPEAYEIPGLVKYLAQKHNCKMLKPAMPDARLTATPKMLQSIGWWPYGKDDAQSAAQHMLSWMKRENCVPGQLLTLLAESSSARS
jgi:hypothetical protein